MRRICWWRCRASSSQSFAGWSRGSGTCCKSFSCCLQRILLGQIYGLWADTWRIESSCSIRPKACKHSHHSTIAIGRNYCPAARSTRFWCHGVSNIVSLWIWPRSWQKHRCQLCWTQIMFWGVLQAFPTNAQLPLHPLFVWDEKDCRWNCCTCCQQD